MRLPLVPPLLALGFLAGCAHPQRPAPAPPAQASLGDAARFGTGIVAASPEAVTLALSAPAFAAVVRVFPGRRAELASAGSTILPPGSRRIRLPLERTRVWVATPAGYQLWRNPDADRACVMQRVAGLERPQDPQSPPAQAPRTELLCVRRADIRPEVVPTPGHWELSEPGPLGEHYLVVVAAAAPFDETQLATLLGELDISLVSGAAAAAVIPAYLVGEGGGAWGAWVVHRP